MAFLVQDDTGVTAANAYISVDEFKTYHDDRGKDYSGYGNIDIERAIVAATDYMDDRFTFVGEKSATDQRTEWPRANAYDRSDLLLEGVPTRVKEACAEFAFIALTNSLSPTPEADDTGRIVQSKSSSVGPISESVTYVDGSGLNRPSYPVADFKLRGLTVAGGVIRRS